ncbi:MAG: GMP reductase [Candidatus Woesearchaeota archaeon]
MRIDNEIKLDFSDVLIRPKRSTLSSRKEVSLERSYRFLHSGRSWNGIPIMTSNMDTTGTFSMARALSRHKVITILHKFYTVEELGEFFRESIPPDYLGYSMGIRDDDFIKFKEIVKKGLVDRFRFITLDVPNAYLERFLGKLKEIRKMCPDHIIIAGNVVTNEMTEEILLNGADIVKIGVGSGAACTTRQQTGVGYPQLSAVIECADAAHGISNDDGGYGLIISDGGIEHFSDVAKAFCGGADFVMMGSLFAGHTESGGALVEKDGKRYKEYYGMSSSKAMQKHYGGVAEHRASEGRDALIPYKGDVKGFIHELLGSLRSTGTYIGARKLKEFSRRATFLKTGKQLNTSISRYDHSHD